MKESQVINEQNLSKSKVVLIYDQMNEPSRARMRIELTTLTMTEYFRVVNDQDSIDLKMSPQSRLLNGPQ